MWNVHKMEDDSSGPLNVRSMDGPFGREVLGIDLNRLTDAEFEALYRHWQEDPLVLIRRQALTESELAIFSRRFGELEIAEAEPSQSEQPRSRRSGGARSESRVGVFYVTNLRREDGQFQCGLGSYEVDWHTDGILCQRPPTGAIFAALAMPDDGPQTWWCNTGLAYRALPERLKAEVTDLEALSKRDISRAARFGGGSTRASSTPAVSHPLVLSHPLTGEKNLYFDPNRSVAIANVPHWRSTALLRDLSEHITRSEFVVKHLWRPGDVALWDNARVCHRRDGFSSNMVRLAMRTAVYLNSRDFPVPT